MLESTPFDSKYLVKTIKPLLLTIGRYVLTYFRSQHLIIENKSNTDIVDPVTIVDRYIESELRSFLSQQFPSHNILGEEYGLDDKKSPYTWIIDPIDGTGAFVSGSVHWGILIGLQCKESMIFGIMYHPFTQELLYADNNALSTQYEKFVTYLPLFFQRYPLFTPKDITSNQTKQSINQCILAITTPKMLSTDSEKTIFNTLSDQVKMTRFGGDCYNYGLLAMGHIDIIIENQLKSMDILPLIPLLTGSGAIVTDWKGNSLTNDYSQVLVCCNLDIHRKTLSILMNIASNNPTN